MKNQILKQALTRQIKLNTSFCNYSFKEVKNKQGKVLINISPTSSLQQNTSLIPRISTSTTPSKKLKSYRSIRSYKSARKQSLTYRHHKPLCKTNKNILNTKKQNETKQTECTQAKLNQLEQIEQERRILKEQNLQFFQFSPNYLKQEEKDSLLNKTFTGRINKTQFNEVYFKIQIQKNFHILHCPDIFVKQEESKSSKDLKFTEFIMVNSNNKNYYRTHISEHLFDELHTKEAAIKLNDFSTKPEDCVFFCAFMKPKVKDNPFRYCESFFWVNNPVKHFQKPIIEEKIKNFFENLKTYKRSSIFKNTDLIRDKIWIVDWKGTMSYINKDKSLVKVERQAKRNGLLEKTKTLFVGSEIVCLQIFRNIVYKGLYDKNNDYEGIKPF